MGKEGEGEWGKHGGEGGKGGGGGEGREASSLVGRRSLQIVYCFQWSILYPGWS